MSWVWENGPRDGTDALVLLALADFADDAGRCYPSMRTIAEKARMTERGAQKVIRRLEADGWVSVSTGNGRHGCNQYKIRTEKGEHGSGFNPEKTPNTVHPEHGSPRTAEQKPRTRVQETPNGGSPEPSRTIINRQEQQPREEVPSSKADLTDRERLLVAMGADPRSGQIGPSGRRLGTVADTEEAAKWSAMGLTVERQCAVIAERCAAMRKNNPHWTPGRFAYFSGAMADLVAARAAKPSAGGGAPSDRDAKLRQYARIAGRPA
jgi:hypothetical protein